jgi:hypothetical protein
MIKYVKGDLFNNLEKVNELVIVPHCCNTVFAWGAGFVVPLGKHYPIARTVYKSAKTLELGTNQYVETLNLMIVNMIAQEGVGWKNGVPPIRYEALKMCMEDIVKKTKTISKKFTIVAPMFGSQLAGGSWDKIETMINDIWISENIPVQIHYL